MPSRGITQNLIEGDALGLGSVGTSGFAGTLTELGNSIYHRTRLDFSGTISLTDTGSVNGAQGSVLLYTLPSGAIQLGGGVGSLTLARTGTNATAMSSTGAVVLAIGTATPGTDNATLTSTEANIIQSTAFTLVAGTKASSLVATTTPTIVDGTTTNASIRLNAAVPSTSNTGNTFLTVTGFVIVPWINVGALTANP